MPELPEVEVTRLGILPHIQQQTIRSVTVREARLRWAIPSDFPQQLMQQTVMDVQRRAKYVQILCTDGMILLHLGMSGHLQLINPQAIPVKKHDHVDINFSDTLCLRYHDPRRFGCLLWIPHDAVQSHPLLTHLGVEPLEPTFNGNYLYQRAKKRRVAVKNFIMNQAIVVGVGNIYASESLFQARINPQQIAGSVSLSHYQLLCDAIKTILTQAIAQGGTTLKDFKQSDGKLGYFAQQLQVYGREGEPCQICQQTIKKITQGQRSSFYCPDCQA